MLNKKGNKFTIVDAAVIIVLAAGISYFFFRMGNVLDYHWDWKAIPGYFIFRDPVTGNLKANILLKGFFTTIRISVWASLLAFLLGTISGIMGSGRSLLNRFASRCYVETIRNIPSLVLVIIFYYFVSSQFLDRLYIDQWLRNRPHAIQNLIGIILAEPDRINSFLSAVIALAIYEGAYISEIVRGGINSIQKEQWEAALSMGLSGTQVFLLVILPQAFQKVVSPLAGQFISTIKDSAIVSVISVQELTFQGMELMSATFLTFEIWITITFLYFILTFSLSRYFAVLEKKLTLRQ